MSTNKSGRGKWSTSHSMGTVLNSTLLSPNSDKQLVSQLELIMNNDTNDDYCVNSETERLHQSVGNDNELSNDEDDDSGSGGGSGGCGCFRICCNCKMYKGIIYSSLSSLFFSLSSVIVKYLDNIHPGQLALIRYTAIFLLSLPFVLKLPVNVFGPPEMRHLLLIRGIAGASSLFLRFCSFRWLPIADASVIVFSFPVFVMIFAKIFLNESCAVIKILTLILSIIGLTFTAKLPLLFNNNNDLFVDNSSSHHNLTDDLQYSAKMNHIYGISAAFASTILIASAYIAIRKMKGVHHMVIMFNFGWIAIIETSIITGLLQGFSMPQNLIQWLLIIILGLMSFAGQTLLTRSLQLDHSGPVSIVRSGTDIVFTFIWQILFFRDIPDFWSISGAILVTSGVILIGIRTWVLTLKAGSSLRKKFKFMLI